MNTSQQPPKSTEKKSGEAEELKTEHPISEKDEVKAAEEKMARITKKTSGPGKGKKP